MGCPEGAVLDLGIGGVVLDRPGVAAGGEEVADGGCLRRLLVRPHARGLVDRRRDGLGETGDQQPSAEQGTERDRGAGGGMACANDHEHERDHGEQQCQNLQETEHRLDHRALGGIEPDVVPALGVGAGREMVDPEVSPERGQHEHGGEPDPPGDHGRAERVLRGAPRWRLQRQRQFLGRVHHGDRHDRHGDCREHPEDHRPPEQAHEVVHCRQGEHEERVVLVKDRVGGPERHRVHPDEDVLPLTGEC